MKIQTSAAAWVRIYTSEAARIADASRSEGVDPAPGSGVIAEVITTGAETVLISPSTIGFNDESPVTTNIPVRVTNKSGSTAAITVTLTLLQLEA
jgi:ethanolamine utilization protein EutA (predicted chaperonin)